MLVLTRKLDQTIMIGEIAITVIEVRGDQVRLGIEAPKEVAVHRKEVYEEIRRDGKSSENEAANKAQVKPASTRPEA